MFGRPFCFEKPLLFNSPWCNSAASEARTADALQVRQHSSSATCSTNDQNSKQAYATPKSGVLQLTGNDVTPARQRCRQQQQLQGCTASTGSSGDSLGTRFTSAASQYYLGSLGAALAHGCAAPTAAAAAAAATCRTAAQLAGASLLCAAHTTRHSNYTQAADLQARTAAAQSSSLLGSACSVAAAASPTPAAAAAVAAASVAAAAACHGCPGCKMMLQRLQRCTKCCSGRSALVSAPNGSSASSGSAKHKPDRSEHEGAKPCKVTHGDTI